MSSLDSLKMDSGNLVSTSKTSNIKSLLLEAWRERWTPIDWAINLKKVLPRGISGDVYDLSNCILIQALIGPTPNQLFISYLNHCISSSVVSYGAVLSSISKYQEFSKSQCIICLLDLCDTLKQRINCSGNEEECISLCKSLVSLALWLYSAILNALKNLKTLESKPNSSNQTTNQFGNHGSSHSSNPTGSSFGQSVASVCGSSSQSTEYTLILAKAGNILSFLSSSPFLRALFHVGKLEDQVTYEKLKAKVNEVKGILTLSSPSIPTSVVNGKELIDIMVNFLKVTEWNNCDPILIAISSLQTHQSSDVFTESFAKDSVARTLNTIIAINAILNPTSDIDVCVRQIALVAKFTDTPLSDVCCEIVRSCFIELANHSGFHSKTREDLKWAAFTFLRVPQLFAKLPTYLQNYGEKPSAAADLEAGLEKLLTYNPLLDLTDARSNCDCLELFLKELCQTDLTVEQKNGILSKRQRDLSRNRERPSEQGQGASLILRALPTVAQILGTLDTDYFVNQDGLLNVLNSMVSGKSFDLILRAAASTVKLQSFTAKLIKFNEFSKESTGEGGKASQTRALLFDLTFLMLCHIAQNYGTEIIVNNSEPKDSFFATWCARVLPERGKHHSPSIILSECDSSKVDNLLAQLHSQNFEMKTSLVKWHEVCTNITAAIKEVLIAWEVGALTQENVKNVIGNVKSKMCCLPVVISSWLCSYINTLSNEERAKPMEILQQLIALPTQLSENAPNSAFNNNSSDLNQPTQDNTYKDRYMMMCDISKKMLSEVHPPGKTKSKSISPLIFDSESTLWTMLEGIFLTVHSRSWLDQKDIHNIDALLSVSGPNWFVSSLIKLLLKFDLASDLNRGVGLIHGLFHLDIERCTLCLLVNVLPGYLLKNSQQDALVEPKATSLARLTVMTIFSALSEAEEKKNGRPNYRKRYEFHGDVPMDYSSIDTTNQVNGEHSGDPRPAKIMRKSDSLSALNLVADDTPFMLSINSQSPSSNPSLLFEPLYKAIAGLFKLFATIVGDSVISQRSLFPLVFLEQLLLCGKQDASKVFQFLPFQIITSLIKIMPASISYEFMVGISILQAHKARKIIARALCQLRRAKTDITKLQS